MGEICRDRIDLSPSTEEEYSALQRAILAEVNHVIRKSDALLADMRKKYKEWGWEWPSSERRPDEVSKVD